MPQHQSHHNGSCGPVPLCSLCLGPLPFCRPEGIIHPRSPDPPTLIRIRPHPRPLLLLLRLLQWPLRPMSLELFDPCVELFPISPRACAACWPFGSLPRSRKTSPFPATAGCCHGGCACYCTHSPTWAMGGRLRIGVGGGGGKRSGLLDIVGPIRSSPPS